MRIEVLRLGPRPERDKRMTTHVCLTARAFGASRIYVDSDDTELEGRIAQVSQQFGGEARVVTGINARHVIKESDLMVVHLTMYGQNLAEWDEDRWEDLRSGPGVLVMVGSTKVPREFYELASLNVAVGNQPHSEVAALAVFLDRLTKGESLHRDLEGRMTIIPQERGKKVQGRSGGGED